MAHLAKRRYASFMRPTTIGITVLLIASVMTTGALAGNAQDSPPTYAHFDGGMTTLDGKWAFHLGDDMEWATPSFDDSGWEKLTADKPWGAQGHANVEGYGWYRWHLRLAPGGGGPDQFAILLPAVEDAYQVYWNGQLVGAYGKLPPHPKWSYDLFPRTFGLGRAESGVLAVRVWKAPFGSFDTGLQGGFYAPPQVGSPVAIDGAMSKLDYRWMRSRQFIFGLNALYALVAVFGLLMWLRDRTQWLGFWMGCFAASTPLGLLLLGLKLPLSLTVAMSWNQPVYVLGDISLWFVLLWLLDLRDDERLLRLARTLAIIECIEAIVDGLTVSGFAAQNPVPWQILDLALMPVVMLLELFPFYLIGVAIVRRRRLDGARWTVALLAFLSQTTFVVGVSLQQGSRFTHWTLGQ